MATHTPPIMYKLSFGASATRETTIIISGGATWVTRCDFVMVRVTHTVTQIYINESDLERIAMWRPGNMISELISTRRSRNKSLYKSPSVSTGADACLFLTGPQKPFAPPKVNNTLLCNNFDPNQKYKSHPGWFCCKVDQWNRVFLIC
jgi:hypothetical protein